MPVIGFSVMRQMASANTTIQTLIPDEYRGRIMALYSMTVVGWDRSAAWRRARMAHSFSSQIMGARLTMAAGGVLALAAAAIFALDI